MAPPSPPEKTPEPTAKPTGSRRPSRYERRLAERDAYSAELERRRAEAHARISAMVRETLKDLEPDDPTDPGGAPPPPGLSLFKRA